MSKIEKLGNRFIDMQPLIVANWKMNPKNLVGAKKLFDLMKKGIKDIKKAETIICPPFVYLLGLKSKLLNLKLGAQDCFWEEKGAFTGEVSPTMLKNLGCQYVIIGHSERRKYQKETNEMINKKIKAALKARLKPILCIDNISQIKKGLKEILQKEKNLILAYEPLFAIGTGMACTPEKAKEMKNKIQRVIGKDIKVLYGGSVDSKNAANYIKQATFSGLLVGGASLGVKEFIKIVENVDRVI